MSRRVNRKAKSYVARKRFHGLLDTNFSAFDARLFLLSAFRVFEMNIEVKSNRRALQKPFQAGAV